MPRALGLVASFRPDLIVIGHAQVTDTIAWLTELRDVYRTPVVAIAQPSAAGALASAGVSQVVPPRVLRRPLARAVRHALHELEAKRRLRLSPTFFVGTDAFGSLIGLVQFRGRMRLLTQTERRIFRALMEARGSVVRYDQLAKAAWPTEATFQVPRARVRVHVHNIRNILAEFGEHGPRIELSLLNGYRLVWPEFDQPRELNKAA